MSRCGRCKGKGWHQPIRGVGQIDCPECKGTGVKVQKSRLGSRTVSVPLAPGARCIVCNRPAVASHHVISQNKLDRFLWADQAQKAKADKRNVVPLCYACHDDGTLRLTPDQLHPDFAAFVFGYDLQAALPRYLACGAASIQPLSVRGRSLSRGTGSPHRDVA